MEQQTKSVFYYHMWNVQKKSVDEMSKDMKASEKFHNYFIIFITFTL